MICHWNCHPERTRSLREDSLPSESGKGRASSSLSYPRCKLPMHMSAIGVLHEKLVFNRRVETLANWFARLAPSSASILDVGCGDGLISAVLQSRRPDLILRGIDVLPRSHTHIPVEIFDGTRIPFADQSFDAVLFSDVLHHTPDPAVLLHEAHRVAAHSVLLKDHNRNG